MDHNGIHVSHRLHILWNEVRNQDSDNANRADLWEKKEEIWLVLWQKPLHQQKCQKGKLTTQTTPQKSSIKQRLRTDLGRSVGVTTATQLVWFTGFRAHLPTHRNSYVIEDKNKQRFLCSDNCIHITLKRVSEWYNCVIRPWNIAFMFNLNVFGNLSVRLYGSCGTDWGRSIKWQQTTSIWLVWLTGLRAHLPTNRNSRLIKRTHV